MGNDWSRHSPLGVGIDLVNIASVRELDQRTGGVFVRRTFSSREQAEAEAATEPWSYYAGRFAAKEAVFKAAAHLLPEKTFDFRMVETLNNKEGTPCVVLSPELEALLMRGGIRSVQLILSVAGDYALALTRAVGADE